MRIFTPFLLLLLMGTNVAAQTATFTGATFFTGNNSNWLSDVEADGSGNIYASGYCYGQLTVGSTVLGLSGPGSPASFIFKTDASGNPLWVKEIFSGSGSNATQIELLSDGSLIVAGNFNDKIIIGTDSIVSAGPAGFIARLNGAGDAVWIRHIPSGGNVSIMDMDTDGDDNIYFTGYFYGSITSGGISHTSTGLNDLMYGKLDASGNTVWFKRAGGGYSGSCGLPNNDSGNSISVDGTGHIWLAGHFAYNFTLGSLPTIYEDKIGSFMSKLDSNGDPIWLKNVAGAWLETFLEVEATTSGEAITIFRFQIECYINGDTLVSYSPTGSPYDFVIVKFDTGGNIQWYRQEGLTGANEYVEALVLDAEDRIYVSGSHTNGSQIGDTVLTTYAAWDDRIFLACYDASGTPLFVKQCGGERNYPYAITLNASNDIIMAGSADNGFFTDIAFGSFTCPGPDGHYPYLVTLDNPYTVATQLDGSASTAAFTLYPNPSSGELFILSPEQISHLTIINIQGKTVYESDDVTTGVRIPAHIPSGVYFARVTSGGKDAVQKFVLRR